MMPLLRRSAIAAIFLVFALWIAGPVIATGSWYASHDGMRYPYLLLLFKEAVNAGIAYPRWLPELMGGYGYPTFVYYQPGFFYFSLPFAYAFDVVTACYWSLCTALLIGAFGAYRLCRHYNPPWVAAFFAVVFLFTHYIAQNIFMRGAFSELYAMLWCPWGAHFALVLARRVKGSAPRGKVLRALAGFIGVTVAIVITHPFVTLFWLPFVLALMATVAWQGERSFDRRVLAVGALAVAFVMVVTSPYWLTLFQMKELVRYQHALAGAYNSLNRLRPLREVLPLDPDKIKFWYMAAAVAGFALAISRRRLRVAAAFFVFYHFMMATASAPVWKLGEPVLQFVQFPWRINSVLATIALLGIMQLGGPLQALFSRKKAYGAAAVLVAGYIVLVTADGPFHLRTSLKALAGAISPGLEQSAFFAKAEPLPYRDYFNALSRQERNSFVAMSGGELHPRTMMAEGLPNRYALQVPAAEMAPGAQGHVEERPRSTPHRIILQAEVPADAGVIINQFYFPGWRVLVNGKPPLWREKDAAPVTDPKVQSVLRVGPNGRIRVQLKHPGSYRIEAWYDGPPGWRERNLLILVLAAGLAYALNKRLASAPASLHKSGHADA